MIFDVCVCFHNSRLVIFIVNVIEFLYGLFVLFDH